MKRKRKKNSGRSKKSTQVQEQQQTENSSTSPKRFFVTLIPEQARYQLLSWFGILGGAISILSHMEGVITLGKMAGYIIASWSSLLIFVWGKLLFFLPVIDITDASIFTVMSFAVINLGLSTSRNPSEQSRSLFYKLSVFLAGILLIGIFLGALFKKYGGAHRFLESPHDCAYEKDGKTICWMPIYYEVLWFASRYSSFVTDLLDGMSDASDIIIYPLAIFSLVFVPLLTIVVPYLIVSRLFKRRLDFIVLSSRLWRIIAAIGFLILVNYTSLVLEQGLTFFSKA